MKKPITALLIGTVLVLSLGACSSVDAAPSPSPAQTVVPAVSPAVTVLPSVSPVTEINPAPTSSLESTSAPSPTAALLVPDSHIPGTEAAGEHIANSGDSIYEDEHYIYFSYEYSPDLFIIDKQNKTRQTVPYACRFTVYNGKVYYADVPLGNYEGEHPDSSCIKEYDPRTQKTKNILTLNDEVLSVLVYNGRLYYTLCTNPDFEDAYDIFSIKLDGKDKKKLGPESVEDFCITGNKVYYTEPCDMPPIYEYDLDSGNKKEICASSSQYCPFIISGGKLYYANFETGFIGSVDLKTGEDTVIIEGPCDFTMLGQYVLYTSDALYIYDMNTQNTYSMLELGDYEVYLYATTYNAYIAVCKEDSTELDRIDIKDGKASLESVADIEGGTE